MQFNQFVAVGWLALVCAIAPAHAEKRIALVVGNGAYDHADRLTNPVNDARGVRDALTALKFDVIYGEDLDGKALRRAIGRFNDAIGDADVALVYFAGHGATFNDVPYIVPVDAEFVNLAEMPAELVAVEDFIGELRRAKSVRIAILDACRDNGAEQKLKRSRGSAPSRGLAPMKNPAGLIIAYATQAGATAADSAGALNSPFTAALLHNIATPGLDVTDMFRKVGREVDAATEGRQRPEISISLYEQYALAGAIPPPPAAAAPSGGTAAASDAERAERAWGLIQSTTSLEAIDEFLRQYGNVPIYGAAARARRKQLATVVTPTPAIIPPPPSKVGEPQIQQLYQLARMGGVDAGEFPLVRGTRTLRAQFQEKRTYTIADGSYQMLFVFRAAGCWLKERTAAERAVIDCTGSIGPGVFIPVILVTPSSSKQRLDRPPSDLVLRSRSGNSLADFVPEELLDGPRPYDPSRSIWIRLINPQAESLSLRAPAAPAALVLCVPVAASECQTSANAQQR